MIIGGVWTIKYIPIHRKANEIINNSNPMPFSTSKAPMNINPVTSDNIIDAEIKNAPIRVLLFLLFLIFYNVVKISLSMPSSIMPPTYNVFQN